MVLEGQKIQKGQLLLTISSNEFIQLQETFLTTRSELEFIKADLERQRKLREENVIGEKDFQLIKTKYQTLQARMRAAEANLRMLNMDIKKLADEGEISPYLEIHAPISGYLLTLPSTIGMSASATTELAHIISLDKLHADIFVYEKDIDQVFEEQVVDIEFVNQSIPKTKGRVEFIGRGIDPVKRTVVVHAVFLSPKGNVLPDMTLKATFKGTRSIQLTIPSAAVIRDGNAEYVYVKQANNAFVRADITINGGDDHTVFIEPTAHLKEGTAVVCKGSLLIDGEMKKDGMEE
jgi:cobalt-zinc-cadmium efflux system membrane fusion protein